MAGRLLRSGFSMRVGTMRKNFLINKPFQLKFVFFMMAVGMASLLTTYLVIQGYFREFLALANQAELSANHPFRDLIDYQKDRMNIFFAILALINVLITVVSGIWMSHRIAGPIHRIIQSLKNPSGESPEISTRKDDYFKELPEAINEFVRNH